MNHFFIWNFVFMCLESWLIMLYYCAKILLVSCGYITVYCCYSGPVVNKLLQYQFCCLDQLRGFLTGLNQSVIFITLLRGSIRFTEPWLEILKQVCLLSLDWYWWKGMFTKPWSVICNRVSSFSWCLTRCRNSSTF